MSTSRTLNPSASRLAEGALWLLIALGAWAVLLTALWLHPDERGFGTHQQLGLAPCSFHALTGMPCPGCGLTTAFAFMAHGSPLAALRAHPMGPLLFVLTLVAALYAPWALWRRHPLHAWTQHRAALPALGLTATVGVLTWVLRFTHVLSAP